MEGAREARLTGPPSHMFPWPGVAFGHAQPAPDGVGFFLSSSLRGLFSCRQALGAGAQYCGTQA